MACRAVHHTKGTLDKSGNLKGFGGRVYVWQVYSSRFVWAGVQFKVLGGREFACVACVCVLHVQF